MKETKTTKEIKGYIRLLTDVKEAADELFERANAEGRRRVVLSLLRCIYEADEDFDYARNLLINCLVAVDRVYKFKNDDIGRRILTLALFNHEWMGKHGMYQKGGN